MLKRAMNFLATAALVAGLSTTARANDADVIRESRDRAEIQMLMGNYARALDRLDEEGYAAVYTPDGSFHSGQNTAVGQAALKKVITDIRKIVADQAAKGQKPKQFRHMSTDQQLTFIDKDHARLDSFWLTVFEAVDRDSQPGLAGAGRSIDDLVRLNGHWLIKSRDVSVKN